MDARNATYECIQLTKYYNDIFIKIYRTID